MDGSHHSRPHACPVIQPRRHYLLRNQDKGKNGTQQGQDPELALQWPCGLQKANLMWGSNPQHCQGHQRRLPSRHVARLLLLAFWKTSGKFGKITPAPYTKQRPVNFPRLLFMLIPGKTHDKGAGNCPPCRLCCIQVGYCWSCGVGHSAFLMAARSSEVDQGLM